MSGGWSCHVGAKGLLQKHHYYGLSFSQIVHPARLLTHGLVEMYKSNYVGRSSRSLTSDSDLSTAPLNLGPCVLYVVAIEWTCEVPALKMF
jgi:hypothetical protein